MKSSSLQTTLALTAVLTLGSCGGAPSSTTPDGAVLSGVHALRNSDLEGFLHASFSDLQISEMRAEWTQQMAQTPNEHEKAEFAKTMARLTASGAEKELLAEIEPQLAQMKPQVEMMLGMLEGMVAMAVDSSDELSPQEKEQGRQAVQALVQTLRKNDITEPGRAKKAISIVCKTARKLDLKTMDDVQRLRFDQALERGDVLLAGTKDLLEVYGFSIDDMLDSVEARTVEQSGDRATVEIRYALLGTSHTQLAEMQRLGGRWITARPEDQAGTGELQSGLGIGR